MGEMVSMTDRVYGTCFDRNYLSRGLAMYHSLQRHAPGCRLWVLCLDQGCHDLLVQLALPNLEPVSLANFEAADPEVAATRSSRSVVEYYFTCTPAWMLYVLEREAASEWVTYLDGDLFFYGSPEEIFVELQDSSFAVIPHRYTSRLKDMRKYGIYNVGWVGARNDQDGIAAVKWWREKCVEWCHDYVDGHRFADQGYLEVLFSLFPRVKAIENVGANLAPWNIGNYQVELRAGKVLIDSGRSLIFFHFQGLKKGWCCFIFNNHRAYRAPFSRVARDYIYRPYIDGLLEIERSLSPLLDVDQARPLKRMKVHNLQFNLNAIMRYVGYSVFRILDIFTGRAFFVFRGKAY